MVITDEISEDLEFGYNELKIQKSRKTFAEKFYHEIPIDHYGSIRFPGRFGYPIHFIDRSNPNFDIDKSCGVFKSAWSCFCAFLSYVFVNSCNNVNCPTCYLSSIKRTAMRETKKFDGIVEYLHKMGFRKCFLRHVTFNIKSVPMPTFFDYKKEKTKLYNIIHKLGGRGLIIYHPYRIGKDMNGKYIYPLKMVYSPHFHFIGHIWIPRNFQKRFGFNVWFGDQDSQGFGGKKSAWLYNSKDVYSAIKYCLTHAGYYEGRQIAVWVGCYSNSQIGKINIEKESEDVICEKCHDKVYKIDMTKEDLKFKDGYYIIPDWWSEHLFKDKWLKNKVITYDLLYKHRKKKLKRNWSEIFEKKRKKKLREKKNES